MTNNNGDRLDRIEAIVESNSRVIQAMMEQQATDRLRHEERMARLEENLIETRQLMSRMTEIQSGLTRILINHDSKKRLTTNY